MAQLLEIPTDRVEELCTELAAEYDATDRGFQLVKVAGGWRYQTHPDLAPYVERFVLDGQSGRLSNAALETLAIVAYKQPISRAQVAAIRGRQRRRRDAHAHRSAATSTRSAAIPAPARRSCTAPPLVPREARPQHVDELPPLGEFVPGADVFEALETRTRATR